MTSRERVIAAIEFTGPDRVPLRHTALPAAFAAHPGLLDLWQQYPSDFADAIPDVTTELPLAYRQGTYADEWDCRWTVLQDGYLGQVTGHPLADLAAAGGYHVPPVDATLTARTRRRAETADGRYLCAGWITLFERMTDLCGFEGLMMGLAEGDERLLDLRDRIVAHNLHWAGALLDGVVDAVYFADDWGTQIAPLIAPALWREFFLPAYRRQFARVREAGKHVFLHTDGVTIDLLPDLVDAGVNVFWADLTVNPLDRLARELGGKVCFQALTDVQFILRDGTPEDVRAHARALMTTLGAHKGGFIGCHEAAPDQPWENIIAATETFAREGAYPLATPSPVEPT